MEFPNFRLVPNKDHDRPKKQFLKFMRFFFNYIDNIEASRLTFQNRQHEIGNGKVHVLENMLDLLRIDEVVFDGMNPITDPTEIVDVVDIMENGPEHMFRLEYSQNNIVERIELWLPVGYNLIYIITSSKIYKIRRSQVKYYLTRKFSLYHNLVIYMDVYLRDGYSIDTISQYINQNLNDGSDSDEDYESYVENNDDDDMEIDPNDSGDDMKIDDDMSSMMMTW